jgi:hypothetical protein
MHKIVYLVLGALFAAGAASTGCGDSSMNTGGAGTTAAGGSGGNGNGGTPANGGGNGNGGTPANGGGGGAQALDCATYCTDQLKNCKTDLAQFSDMTSCMAVCSSYPVGKVSDMAGDTLGCRTYHTDVAGMSAMNAKTHCWHGGPTGGDADNTDSAEGICGDGCEAFCNLEKTACGFGTTGNAQYADNATCMTACKALPKPTAMQYTLATAPNGHDFFCYFYHATAASTDPMLHCPHTKVGTSTGFCDLPTP